MDAKEDMDASERYYAPEAVVRFLLDLTNPQPQEEVLSIGLNPQLVRPLLEATDNLSWHMIESNPMEVDQSQLGQSFDAIICGPVFGLPFPSESSGPSESNEEYWVKWSLTHLNQAGRLAIIVPTGMLSNYSQQPIRRVILDKANLHSIIELPSNWASGTATQASILFFTSGGNPNRSIKMIRLADIDDTSWRTLASQIATDVLVPTSEGKVVSYQVAFTDLDPVRLDTQYYDPKYTLSPIPDPKVFQAVLLKDLVDIRSGDRFSSEHFDPAGVPFIQVRNITLLGELELRDVRRISSRAAEESRGYTQIGDVLLTVAGTVGKVALVSNRIPYRGLCIDTSLRRLRIPPDRRKDVLPEYIAFFLRSKLAQLQIERMQSGSVIRVLSSPNLAQLIVFLPDVEQQRKLIRVATAAIRHVTSKIHAAFPDTQSIKEIVEPPLSTPVTIVQPTPAPAAIPQPTWQEVVRAQFPFPVARAFTVFEHIRANQPRDRLKALIDVSEAVVYYVYGILVADLQRRLQHIAAASRPRIITDYSLGGRIDFIREMLKLVKQDASIKLFVPELTNITIGVCVDINSNLRNNAAHVSLMPEAQARTLVQEYEPKLKKLLQSLMPLKDYNLAQIRELFVRNGQFQHTIVSMMGNNSLFRSTVEDLENHLPADTNHVILIDQNYQVLDLNPLYILHAWKGSGMHDHLCFFKQIIGNPPNEHLKVESTQGTGDVETDTDCGMSSLLNPITP